MAADARASLVLIYLAGVAQGLALVAFPAESAIFVSPSGFHLSGAQYGAMFAPQVAMAILASAFGPALVRRLGLRGLLLVGLAGDFAAMALLAVSALLIGSPAAYVVLCFATGALGLGFGATVPTLNTWVEKLSPGQADRAVLTLNALLGVGTALAPALSALAAALGAWWALPLVMAGLIGALAAAFVFAPGAHAEADAPARVAQRLPARFWLYVAAAALYGIVETLNGNWASVYLTAERHVSARDASFALTAFWLMVTLGRLIFAGLDRWIGSKWVYLALPIALAAVFQGVARAAGPYSGIAAFAFAGLACSALLPLTISLCGAEFPQRAALMSGELIASYQVGYGLAAFGVGPLIEFAGLSYAAVYSLAGFVALALASAAWGVGRALPKSGVNKPLSSRPPIPRSPQ